MITVVSTTLGFLLIFSLTLVFLGRIFTYLQPYLLNARHGAIIFYSYTVITISIDVLICDGLYLSWLNCIL